MSKIGWGAISSALLSATIKPLIEKFLIRVIGVSTGFQVWLVTFLGKHAWQQIVEPLLNAAITEGKYQIKVQGNKVKLEKIIEATNENDYNDGVDSLFD